MKISLIQMNSVSDKAANLQAAQSLIEQAVAQDSPDWICLPEVWDYIGGNRATKIAAAESFPAGDAYRLMSDLARKYRVYIHAGSMLEKIPDEQRLYNTTVAFNRDGVEVARYRKIHMFDITAPDGTAYRESAAFRPGDSLALYDCDGIIVGCAICYDLRFPAMFQALRDQGARIIALPSAFTLQTGKDHWEVLCRARAIETQTYFCAAAQTGAHVAGDEPRQTYGHSMIVDPWGNVTGRASDGAGIITSRIDSERIDRVRTMIPVADHRVDIGRQARCT